MKTLIRRMGNSQGVLIPKPLLAEVALEHEAVMTIEGDALVLRPVRAKKRQGWAQASKRIAEAGEDAPVWPTLDHAEDASWQW